jgi:hypothetical protein
MIAAETSSSYVVAPATGLLIWTLLVYAYAAVLIGLFVVMYRRMDSDFNSADSERINEGSAWAMRVGIMVGIIINVSSNNSIVSGIAIVVPAALVLARCAIFIWAREPHGSQRPAGLTE